MPPDPTAAAAAAAAAAPPAPNDDDGALLGSVRLSAPDGFLVSNDLLSDLFVALAECPLTPALDSLMLVDASAAVR